MDSRIRLVCQTVGLWLLFAQHVHCGPVGSDDSAPRSQPPDAPSAKTAPRSTALPQVGASVARGASADDAALAEAFDTTLEGIDLGEAGNLVRLLEQRSRQAAAAARLLPERGELPVLSIPAASRLSAKPSATVDRAREAARDAMHLDSDLSDDRREPARGSAVIDGAGGARGYDGSTAPASQGLIELASPEQRNLIREAVLYLKSLLDHPATWLVIVVVVAVTVVTSVGRHRDHR